MTDTELETEGGGVSRRDMLRRSALVGGALVWTAPAVQSLAAPAFANGSPAGGGNCPPGAALSEVTVLLQCGTTTYWVKYNPQINGGSPTECGPDINVAQSNTDATCTAAEAAINAYIDLHDLTIATGDVCPSATMNGGNLCVGAGCTILAWTVHDGALGSSHCAYKVGDGPVQGNATSAVLQVCTTGPGGTTCFSKNIS